MKTSVKTFAYAAIASIAFLACDTGTNDNTELQDNSILPSSSVLSSSSSKFFSFISSSSSINKCIEFDEEAGKCKTYEDDLLPYEPNNFPSRLNTGVWDWMEEQFASGKNDRWIFIVFDFLSPKLECSALVRRCGEENCYFVENREVDIEEYNEWLEKYHQERAEKRRVSPMIGILVDNLCTSYEDKWLVLMTAEEIVELIEKYYNGLIIDFPAFEDIGG